MPSEYIYITLYTLCIIFDCQYSQNSFLQISDSSPAGESSGPRQRRRWSRRLGSADLMVKSMLDLRQLETFAKSPVVNQETVLHPDLDLGSTISLQTIAAWVIRDVHNLNICQVNSSFVLNTSIT